MGYLPAQRPLQRPERSKEPRYARRAASDSSFFRRPLRNSRYCYSGLRKKCEMKSPTLPDLLACEDSMTKECPQDGSE
ncbi:hypothetical protein MRX96_003200 [Rhipicephalus microplus]